MYNFETFQKYGQENADLAMKSFGTVSKGMQAIAVEMADYSKRSLEAGTAAFEKLAGARSLEAAMTIHTDYAKTAYEGLVAEATKIGELYKDLAKETYAPIEATITKVVAKAK